MRLTRADIGIWVINLPRATSRRARTETQLDRLGLHYQISTGVDGRAEAARLEPTLCRAEFEYHVGREVLPGEVGCYHAHLSVWQDFLDSKLPVMLVLEDDVIFHDEFLLALDEALRIVSCWDMLKLNRIRAKQPILQGLAGKWRLNAYLGPATGLGAYLMTRVTVMRLLPGMLPVTRPIDHELDRIHRHNFRHFGLEPFPSHVDDGNESMITGVGFAEVSKRKRYRRLGRYLTAMGTFFGKLMYLLRTGRLLTKARAL